MEDNVNRKIPKIKFCPYCGLEDIVYKDKVPRCNSCRAVFFVEFSRYMCKKMKPPEAVGASLKK